MEQAFDLRDQVEGLAADCRAVHATAFELAEEVCDDELSPLLTSIAYYAAMAVSVADLMQAITLRPFAHIATETEKATREAGDG